ncbi:MAG: hydroxymethylbilane synthase [Planctomycetia bacterium]|nr:hydroxymethylbilane synthase [Planctomycetia bacterium]
MTAALRIGTRSSPLALWQARHVQALLSKKRPVELVLIETQGDKIRDRPLSQIGGIGLFTKEIQNALLDARVDVAVHSLKDLPTVPVPGLMLYSVPSRAPSGDAFVSTRHTRFDAMPNGARVATSSLRRRSQLLYRRPDLQVEDLRGNVETRLRKLQELDLDAIVLAEAGLRRLGLESHITEILDPAWMLPAVGQGALGLECRTDDTTTQESLAELNDPPTWQAVKAERSFLAALGGGCLVPIGALASVTEETLTVRGVILPADGTKRIAGEETGPISEAQTIGEKLAQRLLEGGARDWLI